MSEALGDRRARGILRVRAASLRRGGSTAGCRSVVPPENSVRMGKTAVSGGFCRRPIWLLTTSHVDMVGTYENRPVRVDLDHQIHRQISLVSPTRDLGPSASARRLSTDSPTTSAEAGRQNPVGLARQEVGRLAGNTCVREARDRHRMATEAFSEPLDEAQQIIEAFPWDEAPRYLLRDRDGIYGREFRDRVHNMGIEEVLIAPRSPWQSPYVERLIGSIRRECLDHIIVRSEGHLRRILSRYFDYYHRSRTHLSLEMDWPGATGCSAAGAGRRGRALRSRRTPPSLRASRCLNDPGPDRHRPRRKGAGAPRSH